MDAGSVKTDDAADGQLWQDGKPEQCLGGKEVDNEQKQA